MEILLSRQQHDGYSKWEKLARGRYKCNIDASFLSQLNRVGIGLCIRDDEGVFCAHENYMEITNL
jgi:hypothetical protein